MSDELPPLPPLPGPARSALVFGLGGSEYRSLSDTWDQHSARYSQETLIAYARAARAQVWREAAEVCEGFDVCDPQHIAREFRARAEKEQG